MARLKEKYKAEVAPALMKEFGYKSVMQIPKVEKVVVNVGCGEARENSKILDIRSAKFERLSPLEKSDVRNLAKQMMEKEALRVAGVVGLVLGTRPDCMPADLLDYLEELSRRTFLLVEYGVESVYDETLRRINRGHTHAQTVDAIRRTAERGIRVGAHLILGLPGESRAMMFAEAGTLSALPLTTLKLHQLQLIRGTRMAEEYLRCPADFHLFSADEYIDLVIDFVERLRPDLVLERFVSQSPSSLLAVPGWGLKNHEFVAKVRRRMTERDARQGRLFR